MPWARKTASWARKARSFGVSVRVVAARNYYSMSSFITRDFSVMAIARGSFVGEAFSLMRIVSLGCRCCLARDSVCASRFACVCKSLRLLPQASLHASGE